MNKGKLFIIESGSDASGKAIQSKQLFARLQQENYRVKMVSYPNYDSDSSILVKMYLQGEFGENPGDVNPYVSSTFYAVDRYASYKREWEDFYRSGGIIIADRYTTSNMVHQAAKMNEQERDTFLDWLWEFEFGMYQLPEPNGVFFLDVPPDISQVLMENRVNKIIGEVEKDIHERNQMYLRQSYETSLYIAKKYQWEEIQCVREEQLRTIDDIHEEIYQRVKKHL